VLISSASSSSLSSLPQHGHNPHILACCNHDQAFVANLTQKDSKPSRAKFCAGVSKCSNTKFGAVLPAHFRMAPPPWVYLQPSTSAMLFTCNPQPLLCWSIFCHWQWLRNSRLGFKSATKCILVMLGTSRAAQNYPFLFSKCPSAAMMTFCLNILFFCECAEMWIFFSPVSSADKQNFFIQLYN